MTRKKKEGVKGTKGFLLEKNWPKLPHYEGKKNNLKLSYLNNRFQQVTRL